MEQQTHYFLALALPGHTKNLLAEWRKLLESRLPFKTWVHPEDFHITLAFLGSAASLKKIQEVKKEINAVVKKHQAFHLQVNGVGTFGKEDSPRILWAGVENSENLYALQQDVFSACTSVGFSLDKRPYHPHITMARRWNTEEKFLRESVNHIVHPKEELSVFTAEHVVLYQTHMNRVPKYQPLSIFPLLNKQSKVERLWDN